MKAVYLDLKDLNSFKSIIGENKLVCIDGKQESLSYFYNLNLEQIDIFDYFYKEKFLEYYELFKNYCFNLKSLNVAHSNQIFQFLLETSLVEKKLFEEEEILNYQFVKQIIRHILLEIKDIYLIFIFDNFFGYEKINDLNDLLGIIKNKNKFKINIKRGYKYTAIIDYLLNDYLKKYYLSHRFKEYHNLFYDLKLIKEAMNSLFKFNFKTYSNNLIQFKGEISDKNMFNFFHVKTFPHYFGYFNFKKLVRIKKRTILNTKKVDFVTSYINRNSKCAYKKYNLEIYRFYNDLIEAIGEIIKLNDNYTLSIIFESKEDLIKAINYFNKTNFSFSSLNSLNLSKSLLFPLLKTVNDYFLNKDHRKNSLIIKEFFSYLDDDLYFEIFIKKEEAYLKYKKIITKTNLFSLFNNVDDHNLLNEVYKRLDKKINYFDVDLILKYLEVFHKKFFMLNNKKVFLYDLEDFNAIKPNSRAIIITSNDKREVIKEINFYKVFQFRNNILKELSARAENINIYIPNFPLTALEIRKHLDSLSVFSLFYQFLYV